MWLEKIDRRACEILLSAASRKATVAEFRDELQRERIYSKTWSPMFKALGLVCVPYPNSEERFITFIADNVVAFVRPASSEPLARCGGGSAA
jgi:hypothetical protein